MAYIEVKATNFRDDVNAAVRTMIVNTDHITTIEKIRGGAMLIRLNDGVVLMIGARYAEVFDYVLFKSVGPIYRAYQDEESDRASA